MNKLFAQVFGVEIFESWMRMDQPPIVQVPLRGPLRAVTSLRDEVAALASTQVVSVRCWSDRGGMSFKAAAPADVAAIEEWAHRYRDTSLEEFRWVPDTTGPAPRVET